MMKWCLVRHTPVKDLRLKQEVGGPIFRSDEVHGLLIAGRLQTKCLPGYETWITNIANFSSTGESGANLT
jgi:hypothetical protein